MIYDTREKLEWFCRAAKFYLMGEANANYANYNIVHIGVESSVGPHPMLNFVEITAAFDQPNGRRVLVDNSPVVLYSRLTIDQRYYDEHSPLTEKQVLDTLVTQMEQTLRDGIEGVTII